MIVKHYYGHGAATLLISRASLQKDGYTIKGPAERHATLADPLISGNLPPQRFPVFVLTR